MKLRKILLYTIGFLLLIGIGILLVFVSIFSLDKLASVFGVEIDRGIFAITAGISILYLAKIIDRYIRKNLRDSHRG